MVSFIKLDFVISALHNNKTGTERQLSASCDS